mgnify:CR=1 FL=1
MTAVYRMPSNLAKYQKYVTVLRSKVVSVAQSLSTIFIPGLKFPDFGCDLLKIS